VLKSGKSKSVSKTFFEDYDKLRKGFCIEDKFISGLASAMEFLCISLNE
jgi:hypothetical protein